MRGGENGLGKKITEGAGDMGMKVVGGSSFIGCKIRVKTLQTTEPKGLKSQLS